MNLFLVFNFLITLTSLVLILILTFYGKAKIHRIWALCNIAIFCWGIGTVLFSWTDKIGIAAIGWKIGYAGGIFIPIFYYHTVYILVSDKPNLKNRKFLWFSYIFAIIASSLTLIKGNLVMPGFRLMFNSIYYPLATPIYSIIFLVWGAIAFFASYQLYRFMKLSKGIESVKAKYLLFAFSIGFIGGGSAHLPSWGIPVYPFGNFGVALYAIIGTYAILRHQLLEIEVIIKKTLVFASLFAIVLGIFVGITVLTQEILAGGRLLGLAISSIIIILIVRPLENFLIGATDRFLFQKKYDYKQVLKSFIDEVITVLDLDVIIKKTLELLDKMFHPERTAILLLDSDKDTYVLHGDSGYDKNIIFEDKSRIPIHLKTRKNIISAEDRNLNEVLKREMDSIGTSLIIPLMIHNELIGIVLLGKKKSDIPYTKEDLDILTDLAQTEATAISNSRTHILLLQAKEKEQQTEHLVSLAFVVTNISHELRNPIQIILGAAETTLDAIDTELHTKTFDKKNKDTISYVKSKLKTIMEKSDKTNEMLNSILHSLKITPKNFTFLSIKEVATEAISRVEPYLEPANIKATNRVPDSFPRIKGDRITLEQVFVNLLTNAIQAMEFTKKGNKVNITAFDMDDKIRIEISDNGPGIPEQDVRRIFEPFYTTKDNLYSYKSGKSKGAGLGLMIVHQTIARHEGAIYVRSKVGEGTTFVIDLPKRV